MALALDAEPWKPVDFKGMTNRLATSSADGSGAPRLAVAIMSPIRLRVVSSVARPSSFPACSAATSAGDLVR